MRKVLILFAVAVLLTGAFKADASTLRFDMGSASSPVAEGFQKVVPADEYSASRGYGWETNDVETVSYFNGIPLYESYHGAAPLLLKGFVGDINALTGDSAISADDLVFRADVPNGTYRVSITIGDMGYLVGSMDLRINGQLIEQNLSAWHPGTKAWDHRRIMMDPWGFYNPLRYTVEVDNGSVQIKLSKDQSIYDELVAKQTVEEQAWEQAWSEEFEAPAPYIRVGMKEAPYYPCGWPFSHNAIMAIEIAPDIPLPVAEQDGKLLLSQRIKSLSLKNAVAAFNSGGFEDAIATLEKVHEPGTAQAAKAIIELWIAGRLETEFIADEELVRSAIPTLERYVAAHPDELRVAEILQDAKIFAKGWDIHINRAASDGESGHFIDNSRAVGQWLVLKKGSPLYHQALLNAGRAEHMLIPYFPARGTFRELFEELSETYPENRHVKYHLTGKWEPYGDGTDINDWVMKDYTPRVQNSPEWVKAIYPPLQNEIDWCEWWITFKQDEKGSLGGGWSDDVEIVGAFGYHGYLGRGISDMLVQGTANLVNGLWEHSVDQELGFSQPLTDAEHAAEETGNTLGMMAQIDYGNPIWVERAMKTSKLIRDLWTDYDVNGNRRFRANYFCASRMGEEERMFNDNYINYRAIRPALAFFWYNQSPPTAELITELAESWRVSSMSTQRGKPEGIIPSKISFPDAIIGGKDSDMWYGKKMPGGGYKPLLLDVFYNGFHATKNPKFLEPMKKEYELAEKYGVLPTSTSALRLQLVPRPLEFGFWKYDPVDMAERRKKKKGKSTLPEHIVKHSEEWYAHGLKMTDEWLMAKKLIERREGPLVNDITKADVIKSGEYCASELQWRWPINTSEAGPTDRIGFLGFCNPFLIYTGGRWGGPMLEAAVTYDNTTRDFAAIVLANDPQGLRILYHSLADDEREIGIVPWHLEPGAKYRLVYGPDANEDEKMDSVLSDEIIDFTQRGTPIRVKVKPDVTYAIEIDQTEAPSAPALAPDPAITASDLRVSPGGILVRVHNIGSVGIRGCEVAVYEGDPEEGGKLIGKKAIPYLHWPADLNPATSTIGFGWPFGHDGELHEIYAVIDPDGKLDNEITTFNNKAHATLAYKQVFRPDELVYPGAN